MTREQMLAPFADEELQSFAGRGGKTMTYIEDETVMDRLDFGYGPGNWQIAVEPIPFVDGTVKVRLGVRSGGAEWIWFEDFGYPNREGGESLKEAVSDGIRRCGRFVGIARDLYRKDSPTPSSRPDRPSNKAHDAPERPVASGIVETKAHPAPEPVQTHDGGLIGVAKVGTGKADFELRQTPAGPGLSFRLVQGRQGIKIVALGPLAEAIATLRPTIEDKRVTVWGSISDEEFEKEGRTIRYQAMTLDRIQTPDGMLPADDGPPADLPLFGEDAA